MEPLKSWEQPEKVAEKAESLLFVDAMSVRELGPRWVRALLLHWRDDSETFKRVAMLDPASKLANLACEREKGWTKQVRAIWVELPSEQLVELAKSALEWADNQSRSKLFSEIVTAHASRVTSLDEAKLGKDLIEACGYNKRFPSYLKSLQQLQVKGLTKWIRKHQPKNGKKQVVEEDPFANVHLPNVQEKCPDVLKRHPKDYRNNKRERLKVYDQLIALCRESPSKEVLKEMGTALGLPRKLTEDDQAKLDELLRLLLQEALQLGGEFKVIEKLIKWKISLKGDDGELLSHTYTLLTVPPNRLALELNKATLGLLGAAFTPKFPQRSLRCCFLGTLSGLERAFTPGIEKDIKKVDAWTRIANCTSRLARIVKKVCPKEEIRLWSATIRAYARVLRPEMLELACEQYLNREGQEGNLCKEAALDLLTALTVADSNDHLEAQSNLILCAAIKYGFLNKTNVGLVIPKKITDDLPPFRIKNAVDALNLLEMTDHKDYEKLTSLLTPKGFVAIKGKKV